jgi:hypothetical protein
VTLSESATEAIAALTGTRWAILDAPAHVEPQAGLYAIYGDEQAYWDLGLVDDEQAEAESKLPLYIGKAEKSFVSRDLQDHFAALPGSTAKTGGSTVRRSFAALLRVQLGLQAVPRNLNKPGYFSMYALGGEGDARLTAWMHDRLTLAVWPASDAMPASLADVETELIRHLTPPINIAKNPQKLARLRAARTVMAAEARAWTPGSAR